MKTLAVTIFVLLVLSVASFIVYRNLLTSFMFGLFLGLGIVSAAVWLFFLILGGGAK